MASKRVQMINDEKKCTHQNRMIANGEFSFQLLNMIQPTACKQMASNLSAHRNGWLLSIGPHRQ